MASLQGPQGFLFQFWTANPHIFTQLDQRSNQAFAANSLTKYLQDVAIEFVREGHGYLCSSILLGSKPGLPEWNVPDVTLHLNQFKVRFRRFGQGQFTSYPHCVNLRELHFGKLAGFVGFFKPLSSRKVTYLCVDTSIQLCDWVSRSSKGPGGSCKLVRLPFSCLGSIPAFAA